jgi:hypothetical protein
MASKIVVEAGLALRGIRRARTADVMIARHQEVRDTTLRGQAIDQGNEADVPLPGVAAGDHGVARLQDETDGIGRRPQTADLLQHRIDEQRMFVLNCLAIPAPACIAIDDKRKACHIT